MVPPGPRKLRNVQILAAFCALCAGEISSGVRALPLTVVPSAPSEAHAKLIDSFHQILDFFANADFSLLAAWREMRASGDPAYFEHEYPEISKKVDDWVASLSRFDVSEAAMGQIDFTFILNDLAPIALDPSSAGVRRDNALLTICNTCTMDYLRCDATTFHRFLASVVADDTSTPRRVEALATWRGTGGFIDESLLESILASPAGRNVELRAEVARCLFGIDSRRSLQAQRRLAGTDGVDPDPSGAAARIACSAIRRFAPAWFSEAAPDLIAALKDPSRDVRACAAESLTQLSGRDFGFDPSDDGPASQEAIARWRDWWRKTGRETGRN